MCGILFTNNACIKRNSFLKALDLLHHRGPDATGYTQCGTYQLGHKRLKILDLDNRSNQPFYSHDGRYIIIYNGEIYNFKELALENSIQQKTTSDTEVIVQLYSKHGPNALTLLNGMFALVIVDTITNELFIARDRLGVKPLYMHRAGDRITLASEIAPLIELTGEYKYDEIGLRQYRKLRTFFNGRTAYKNIEMFPPGHYMLNGKLYQYWKLPEEHVEQPTDGELKQLIIDSVHKRLISDVTVGSYLSGGLDSTIIAALAQKPHTWTVGFSDDNEFKWARLAAKHIHSMHREILINHEEFVSLASQIIKKRREPLSVPNEVLLYKMTNELKKENTVILSGEGADELFFGYDRIFRWAAKSQHLNLAEFDRLYSYGTNNDLEIIEDALSPFMHLSNTLDIMAHFFQVAHLHGLLRRLDNATMLCSVEARVPFVDHHPLIERMAGVAFDYRMKGGVVKYPLKMIFRDLIPNAIIERVKVGFPVPLDKILFSNKLGATAMDSWLEFNLSELCGTNITQDDLGVPRKEGGV
jgi:asparagine synthase (glutamine-hydrolysing)